MLYQTNDIFWKLGIPGGYVEPGGVFCTHLGREKVHI